MKLLLCLSELPEDVDLVDVTDKLVDIHVQFSRTRFAWELEKVLAMPVGFKPTLEKQFVAQYKAVVGGLKGNNAVCDSRLQVLLPTVEKLLSNFDLAVYLPEKARGLARKTFENSKLTRIRNDKELKNWLE